MQVKSTILNSVFVLIFSTLFIMSGCSNNPERSKLINKKKPDTKQSASSTKQAPKNLLHIHPSNPCTMAVTHSHEFKDKNHKHSYDCENTNEYISNAHIHPATKNTRRYRHVHPNGSVKHTHLKQ